MTVLVTGGAGYIGSHTVIELLNDNQEVIVVDNFSNSKPEVLNRIQMITGKQLIFYEKNIEDRMAMDKIFKQHAIDIVIHFAGYKAVGESVTQPLKYYHNNLSGTIVLLEVMQENQVKNIIFSSSATVYGETNRVPFKETMTTGEASNPYGYTKLVLEKILQDLSQSDPDWSVTLLRYFNPLGAHESGLIGEDPQGIPNNLMPYLTQVAIGKRPKLLVFGKDYPTHDGTGVRDYIHVVELAQGHQKAIKHNLEHQGVAIFNLGTGHGYSVLDIIKTFEKANQVTIPYEIIDRRPGDIAIAYADPSKANEELDWEAFKDLYTMCQDSWHWQKKNPDGF
ncbi:UDP-glucose 4-epimerase GalE [Facklamia miroungae]|uniref:UDP-glucose 4-epimerase n=1 Tax=Facklamia miroungae TaxID=120956 RepID=A0A1G7TKM4_9LACT|nr:UDP-glucose 4-epimerase GalE [Facklamia miroungae]NKZ29824.1 UDP-glucose 4-epimerase GalE [Facklamia miroungae]SDG35060.1 UDP-glucose 4-epimerase [Facklamia miroungae]